MVESGPVTLRSRLPVAGNCAVHDAVVDAACGLVADAQPVRGAGSQVRHHRVGTPDQPLYQRQPGLGFQVHRDGSFARALAEKSRAHARLAARAHAAHHVTTVGRLDLDHLGAHQCQLIRAQGPGVHVREIDDAGTGQKVGHGGVNGTRRGRRLGRLGTLPPR